MNISITTDSRKSIKVEKICKNQFEIRSDGMIWLLEEEGARELCWELITHFHDLLEEEAKDTIEDLKALVEYMRVGGVEP